MNHPDRVDNFNGGPAALPLEALQKAQAELLNFNGTGISMLELGHRTKAYAAVHQNAKDLLRQLLKVPNDYDILFLQGGASLQFAMLPMNYLTPERSGAYALTGSWSKKALDEAKRVGPTRVAFDGKPDGYRQIPPADTIAVNPSDAYLHVTSNNTIVGSQWKAFPDTGSVPLVADMSSDILSRAIDVSKFAMIYAGAQKNLGPAGVTVVIVKKSFVEQSTAIADERNLSVMLRYDQYAANDSLYNTPPVFAIYVVGLVLEWLAAQGGVEAAADLGRRKADLVYGAIDASSGFYQGHCVPEGRSTTNVTFRLPTPELDKAFLAAAEENGLVGLGGHRSVGGCRASLYNAVSLDACERLVEFMDSFRRVNG
ncbi:3-phosphoserine/phosphohydroxythreonine transaminase [Alicyclobacillus sp. ALC3]|uniref:3-phosphoserine/phosphohydroxythreonine transaminase n=1 Tax=Alicyclobacillus sp. ALC3 TaxID=2796143 RepID=UPI002379FAF9|nr:3-phosphoserine/phosphohydroxythreonine transaminase [Alicyclobacillus sp. ALC3]WDL97846.1 3-phosphoserine/phosphohydroxythreonine transaminase [Alicyclobacillus sp. ALC3]